MEKETFFRYFDLYKEHLSDLEHASKARIDLIEFSDPLYKAISILWKSILTEEGIDWLEWFYYEKYDYSKDQPREDLKAWDEDGNELCQDLDSLYNYLTENKYFIRLFEERA